MRSDKRQMAGSKHAYAIGDGVLSISYSKARTTESAKAQQLGIWSGDVMAPWEWRKAN